MTGPTLHIVIGTAGSGKSTIAQNLARRSAAAYLDKDAMSARFVEAALLAAGYDAGDRESNSYYREHILPLEYDSLLDVAGANLRIGRSVVIDAPFSPYLSDPGFITTSAQRFDWPAVDIEVVRVRVSPTTLQDRLRKRGLERDRVKLANWDGTGPSTGVGMCLDGRPAVGDLQRPDERPPGARRRPATPRPALGAILMISGNTTLIAHLGYPTYTFKSSLICNPWFDRNGIDAAVVPMGIRPEDYPPFFRSVFTLTNLRGALVTMPHKVITMELVDEISPDAEIAGATNAVLLRDDGTLLADQFDGAGFLRGAVRKGFTRPGNAHSSSATAGSVRRSRPRWPAPASPGSACSIRTPPPLRRSPSASPSITPMSRST